MSDKIDLMLAIYFKFQGSISKIGVVNFSLYPLMPCSFVRSDNTIEFFGRIEFAKGVICNPDTVIAVFSHHL